jgi:dihydrodipicolinate synthase/N-acetylneuraminate lyase
VNPPLRGSASKPVTASRSRAAAGEILTTRRTPACVLATAVAPWTETYSLDEGLFRHEVATLLAAGYSHLYIFGTAGEGYAVDEPRFEQVARVFSEQMQAAGAEPMVGVISLSTATILRRIAWARDTLGVGLFQISLPGWGALEDAEVRTFFDAVLGQFEDCQFLHYNLLRTKRLVTATQYAAIAADHPNLVATKNSTDSMLRVRELIDTAPMLQHFLNEHGFVFGSLIGECGLLISLATTNLAMGQRYFDAGRARDVDTLVQLEGELSQIGQQFAATIGGGAARIDGAFDKVLWRLHDPRFPLRLLPPYQGADASAADAFQAFLQEHYPHWAAQRA